MAEPAVGSTEFKKQIYTQLKRSGVVSSLKVRLPLQIRAQCIPQTAYSVGCFLCAEPTANTALVSTAEVSNSRCAVC